MGIMRNKSTSIRYQYTNYDHLAGINIRHAKLAQLVISNNVYFL